MKTRLIGVLFVTLLTAVACGGTEATSTVAALADDSTDTPADEATGEVDTEAQLLAFAECIRSEGFDIDDPTVDADGNVLLPRPNNTSGQGQGPPEGFVEARDACAEHLEGVTLGFQGGDQTELQDQLLEFAACMRDNGFDLPDPDFSAGGGRGLLQQIDQEAPAYQAAFANCDDILSTFGRGGGNGN